MKIKELLKFKKKLLIEPQKYFSINDLDKKIEKYLDYENGFFVELGANDGVNQSNTLYFEKYKNWKGVLIEPTPHNYIECKKNRSEHTKSFCAACTSFDYNDKFVEIMFSNLMTIPINLESDIYDKSAHALEGKQFLNEKEDNFIFGALARTLNDILIEALAPKKIDLLSLDVEGAEIEVLKGIDHNDFRFKFICVECRDIEKLEKYLNLNNYILIEKLSIHDYLFKDNIFKN
jgi:FkbM family methyltransferase